MASPKAGGAIPRWPLHMVIPHLMVVVIRGCARRPDPTIERTLSSEEMSNEIWSNTMHSLCDVRRSRRDNSV